MGNYHIIGFYKAENNFKKIIQNNMYKVLHDKRIDQRSRIVKKKIQEQQKRV